MGNSWYDTGFDGMDAEQRRLDEQQGPGRLWIPEGAFKDVVMIDDEPVCIYEHNPKINGNYRNWMTCLQGSSDEVVCCQMLGPQSRYYCGYATVVDCSEWQDNRGNKHQYEMRLCQYKMKSLKKLRRKKEDKGALVNTMWRFTREDDKSPVCGDEWEFKRDVDMAKLFPFVNYRGKKLSDLFAEADSNPEAMERIKRIFQIKPGEDGKLPKVIPPFNYFEILKPKPPKDVRILLGAVQDDDDSSQSRASGSKRSGSGGGVKEDEVPF